MKPRFYLLNNELFATRTPGEAPTEPERKMFKSPKLKPGMPERKIWAQVGAVIQSVLKAAKCTKLSFSHVAERKANGGNGSTDIFNGAGIFRDPPVFKTTDQTSDSRAASKGDGEVPSLNTRSCFWLEVPIHVKSGKHNSMFFFNTKPSVTDVGSPGNKMLKEAEGQRMEGARTEDGEGDDKDGAKLEDTDKGSEDGTEGSEGGEDDEDSEGEDDYWEVPPVESEHSTSDPVLTYIRKCYPSFVNVSEEGMKALDQFVEHQSNVFKYQHRTFCYSVYICFDMARLLYIDRAGAFVSEPFSWVKPTSLLHDFVWKLAKLAKANRRGDMGHDTTARVVSPVKRQRFVREAKNTALAAHIRAGLKKAAASDCPLYELTVEDVPPSPHEWFPDEPFPERSSPSPSPTDSESASSGDPTSESPATSPTPTIHRFIVGRPHFSSDNIIGRCTKGFMAFDVTDPEKWVPCFLKDSWRPYVPGRTRPEHLVYERLKRMNVEKGDGVAALICGGDVGGSYAQYTRVQKAMPRKKRAAPHIHYRLVTEDIGVPLSEFRNFGELSSIFADVLKAHRKVWEDAKVLHHDISLGNIMIRVEGEKRTGFLIDWDLAVVESELPAGIEPVKSNRIGTWQFCSAVSLLYPRKPYRRSDDIESFIHTFTYLVLRYHRTDALSAKDTAERIFTPMSLIKGFKVGGDMKSFMFCCGNPPFSIWTNAPLESLLLKIFGGCKASYSRLDASQMQYTYGPEEKPLPMPTPPPMPNENVPKGLGNRPRRRRMLTDDEISHLEASGGCDEEERILEELRREERWARENQLPLCAMDEFLASPESLIKLFEEFARKHSGANDKARDQFIPGTYELNAYRSLVRAGNAGNATLATNASVAPRTATGDVPKAVVNAPAPPSMKANVSSKKRAHPTTASENGCPDEVQELEGPSSERCPKRPKIKSDEENLKAEDVDKDVANSGDRD
ncbi:hypothetical protein GSI_07624 [Ganoderma sinense ZZ0214-1]|uniref:Fungal-type protein kinase domain-containing protein n=1 Tax=Ganoderma sinense ZZ0214-1 TaxID=1077348 RepID=A0A2G8S9K5_9APHY|nr:hypothetical protein GSI_07624 [Ganoderma sinense ZZ0214-1]